MKKLNLEKERKTLIKVAVGELKTLDKDQMAELMNLWHLSKMESYKRYERLLWTSKQFAKEHPEFSSTNVYKILTREV